MRIELITSYFREEFLAPLFFLHYDWVDRVTLITERWADDKLDDGAKVQAINDAIARSVADWIVVVDFDEFIFTKDGYEPRTTLQNERGDIMMCEMLRVWRHMSDQDIDRTIPPRWQRRHGQPDHVKPCIFRRGPVTLHIGNHQADFPSHWKWGKAWSAVHWANADPEFGLERSVLNRQCRLSDNNYKHSWGMIPEWLDPKFLEKKYAEHMNDPLVL